MTQTAWTTVFAVWLAIVGSPNLVGAAERQPARNTSTMTAPIMAAESTTGPPIPQEAMSLQGRLYPRLQPSARAWVGEQARRLAAGTMTVESLHPAVRSRFMGQLGTGDKGNIEEVLFVVMMQAVRDNDENMKKALAELKGQQERKKRLGGLLANVQQDIVRSAGGKGDDPCTPPRCGAYARDLSAASFELSRLYPNRGMRFQEPKTVNDLKPLQGALKKALDGMDEKSEMTSLRLQTMMDRRSKLISTLSNIMKKISNTQDTVVQNLK